MENSNTEKQQLKIWSGLLLIVISIILAVTLYLSNSVRIAEAQSYIEAERISSPPKNTQSEVVLSSYVEKQKALLPPKEIALSPVNKIRIDKLEVDAEIVRTENPDDALELGAWMPLDFNTPSGNALVRNSEPVIIASHLYGYDYWSDEFRNDVSFKGLETLIEGDIIEVTWDQRVYKYEVKSGEINTEISSYENDLILYTCNDLSGSDLRIIKYADFIGDKI